MFTFSNCLPAYIWTGLWRLTRIFHFETEAAPEERLRAFLGDEFAERVMSGFVAVLARDDLPSASRIVEVHCKNEYCVAEAPMICGIMEMFRRGHRARPRSNGTRSPQPT